MMKILDLHTHTQFSDGEATVEDILDVASSKGYEVGISDHVFCDKMITFNQIETYFEELKKYNVYRGVEANIGDYIEWPDRLLNKLDYVISSVHSFSYKGKRIVLSEYFGQRCGHRKEYIQQYDTIDSEMILETVLEDINNTFQRTRVNILGHSTVLPFYEGLKDTLFLNDWENEVISLCLKYNVAIEISGLWKEPNRRFIEKSFEKSVCFSMGSDCHRINEICNLDYPLMILNDVNIPYERMFIPR